MNSEGTPIAGVANGADGLLIEVHSKPEKAFSDGAQSFNFDQFRAIMDDLLPYLELRSQTLGV